MPDGTDRRICVVGAGALGVCTALALARRGFRDVTVLEAGYVAGASSGLSVGIVETQYIEPLDIALRVAAMETFHRLRCDHGLAFEPNGYLRLGHDDEAVARFEQSVAVQRELGVRDSRVVGRDELRDLIPDMATDDVTGALYGPSDGFVDGHLFCTLTADLAEAAGVRLHVRHRVTEVEAGAAGEHVLVTERGRFEADVVVNAAGAWAGRLAALWGHELPLEPQRHEAVMVHLPRDVGYVVPSVMDYTPHSGEMGLYFRHERPGQLVAGLHTEEIVDEVVDDPDDYARGVSNEFLEGVAERLTVRLPGLADAALAHGWAGLYPVSPDGRPLVGPMPSDASIVAAAGAGGSGIQLAPTIGELVADWIEHGEPRFVAGARALAPGRGCVADNQG